MDRNGVFNSLNQESLEGAEKTVIISEKDESHKKRVLDDYSKARDLKQGNLPIKK